MKLVRALAIAVILLTVMTPVALAADSCGSETTVYVSVSVDGKLLVAAQPVAVTDMTVQGVIKAAHAEYYSGGASGYTAGIADGRPFRWRAAKSRGCQSCASCSGLPVL